MRLTEKVDSREIKTLEELKSIKGSWNNIVIRNMDLSTFPFEIPENPFQNVSFLGCILPSNIQEQLKSKGARFYEPFFNIPYEPYRSSLYTWKELMEGEKNSLDLDIYNHFSQSRYRPDVKEALAQRIHDHAIDSALRELLQPDEHGMTSKRCIGIMGGHSTQRDDPYFTKVALAAKLLTEAGFYVVSGGGPGIMEAANLGAYFGGKKSADLLDAIEHLISAPHYSHPDFSQKAIEVLEKHPEGSDSLAVPTWFYGHEPSNLFASHIAKYFSNSIREDTLLALSLYGVVYAPGSAGTTQEIFQDAAQNHYATYGYYSPMVFLGTKRYQIDTLIYPLLRQLAYDTPYFDMLGITDDPKEVLSFIQSHPPIKADK